jgi:hypothetical protein
MREGRQATRDDKIGASTAVSDLTLVSTLEASAIQYWALLISQGLLSFSESFKASEPNERDMHRE